MQIQIRMTPVKRDDSIVAIGIARFGDIRVRNFTLKKRSDGELFLVMPSRATGKVDKDGRAVYEEIAHPITRELRLALNEAAKESYLEGRPVTLRDKEDGILLIQAEVFDYPFYNRVGKGQLTISDKFVIKDIFINTNKTGELYVTLPNYKMSHKSKDGKDVFSEIVSMSKDFRKELCDSLINEYKMEKAYMEQNRFSIKSRLNEAKSKAAKEATKAASKAKEVVR